MLVVGGAGVDDDRRTGVSSIEGATTGSTGA